MFFALLIYFLSGLLNLLSIHFEHLRVAMIFKALLMPSLATYFIVGHKLFSKNTAYYSVIVALLCSWAGDICWMLQSSGNDYFLYGLMAFLAVHVCYIIAYLQARVTTGNKAGKFFVISRIIIFALTGIALYNALWNKTDELRLPLGIYTLAIITMTIAAVLRREKTSPSSFSFIYGGALMFLVSNGMLVISKFINPFPYNGVLIMLTYILAQFLIVSGILKHEEYRANRGLD